MTDIIGIISNDTATAPEVFFFVSISVIAEFVDHEAIACKLSFSTREQSENNLIFCRCNQIRPWFLTLPVPDIACIRTYLFLDHFIRIDKGVRTKSWTFRAPKGAGNVFKRTTRKSLGIV
jgi:hypothetical protein